MKKSISMKEGFLLLLVFFIFHTNTYAQITIGSSVKPKEGALLDLKQDESKAANSKKGIILPRVKLSSKDVLDIVGGESNLDVNKHIGLIVFNVERKDANEGITNRADMLCPGLHIWNGVVWLPVQKYPLVGLMCDGSDPGVFEQCGDPLKDMEGNSYATANFGVAGCWITQNLASTRNANITLTQNTNASNTAGAFYSSPNGVATDLTQGYLYTWEAAMAGSVANQTLISLESSTQKSSVQGICPSGWVLPSEADWNNLEKEIAENPTRYSTNTTAISWNNMYNTTLAWRPSDTPTSGWGQNMRSTTVINAKTHTLPSKSKSSDAGFNALLTGALESGSAQDTYGNNSSMWTSNDVFIPLGGDSRARYRALSHTDNGVYRGNASKTSMLSIRCKLRD